jgi:hypothetical protein
MNLSSLLKSSARNKAVHLKSVATALALILTTVAANATPITVPNYSFETPSASVATSTNFTVLPGWVFNVKAASQFGTASIASNFSNFGTSSGRFYATINNDAVNVTDTISSAAALATITPLTEYTLTVALGNENKSDSSLYGAPGNLSFSLLANGVVFATETVPNGTIPNGTFEDFSITYSTPASASIIGENLTVQLATLPQQGSAYQPAFDNVRLDATQIDPPAMVPEPATWTLMLAGLCALALCLNRRRQLA